MSIFIDGSELALWFQKNFRKEINEDVAAYVAEFDSFRSDLEEAIPAVQGSYADLPKSLQHQWEILAPQNVKTGQYAVFPIQVHSDLGPMVIGSYRAIVDSDRRIRLSRSDVEWTPSFQRGNPVPVRPDRAGHITPKARIKDSTSGIGGFVGLLGALANRISETEEEVREALEIDTYGYRSQSHSREVPIHRSTRELVSQRAGESAKRAVTQLSVPWKTDSEVSGANLVAWLKRDREPVWLTKLSGDSQKQIWNFLDNADQAEQLIRHVTASIGPNERLNQEAFWGYFSFYISTKSQGATASCHKYDKKITLDQSGICQDTDCLFHPSKGRAVLLNRKTCQFQRIKVQTKT